MAEPTPRGIQATLFDYFQDTEYFDLQEANELLLENQQRDINVESIRARIYEGIDKGVLKTFLTHPLRLSQIPLIS